MLQVATFACLGWGSLVWNRGGLPTRSGWFTDGPLVQVELVRQSRDGRITYVLDGDTPPVRALWTIMDVPDTPSAVTALGAREKIPESARNRLVGSWEPQRDNPPETILDLREWAACKDLAGVVWTALHPRFRGEERKPTVEEVLEYLGNLTGSERESAEEYVRKAPRQVQTPYRQRIEIAFGWVASQRR
jgi:hypothetical protein